MSNMYIAVDKHLIQEEKRALYKYLTEANQVSEQSTTLELDIARMNLENARGMLRILRNLRMLPNWQEVEEKVNRTNDKHLRILNIKRTEKKSKNNSKNEFIKSLEETLKKTRSDVGHLELITRYEPNDTVIVHYKNGYKKEVNIALNSNLGIIKDVCKSIA